MIKNNKAFSVTELIVAILIISIVVAIMIPASNFNFIASSIISESIVSSKPLKKNIENYYYKNQSYPNNSPETGFTSKQIKLPKYVTSIQLYSNGKILITYDTKTIKWASSWWYNYFDPVLNDLTDKKLILSPEIIKGEIVWDECNFGDVPKRNRNYECSKHK